MSTVPPSPYPSYPSYPPIPSPERRETSGMAVASLVFGILGCVPFVTGLLAVIFGILGIRRTRDPRFRGTGLAIAGLILGLLSLGGWSLFSGTLYVGYKASQPAREAAEAFIRELCLGRIDSAYGMTAEIDRQEFEAAARSLIDEYGAVRSVLLFGFYFKAGATTTECELVGMVEFEKSVAEATFRLIKVGDAWKVTRFEFK